MKVGIIGPYRYEVDRFTFNNLMPKNTTEIICGRTGRLQNSAELHTLLYGIKYSPINYDYSLGNKARLIGNIEIIKKSDLVIIFSFKKSRMTNFVIKHCVALNIPFKLIELDPVSLKNI